MASRNASIRSLVVALVVGLLAPALWFALAGESKRTPTIEKSFSDSMTEAQRTEWIQNNSTPVSFWEHVKGTPLFIVEAWKGYLLSSSIVFVLVFVINSAFLSGGKK